ncbi:hypothetical protein EVAR_57257_1 [Eumeta japonica]|uniref:Histone-lysine N-methyltransferase SETMAR n=1 Tax=Eumeta variegata TaxID=151549 RepID=A0A4C1ZYS1_EUMVA|nr:hypothetical protein EVAR_57257_1 [Eumeta japonica]
MAARLSLLRRRIGRSPLVGYACSPNYTGIEIIFKVLTLNRLLTSYRVFLPAQATHEIKRASKPSDGDHQSVRRQTLKPLSWSSGKLTQRWSSARYEPFRKFVRSLTVLTIVKWFRESFRSGSRDTLRTVHFVWSESNQRMSAPKVRVVKKKATAKTHPIDMPIENVNGEGSGQNNVEAPDQNNEERSDQNSVEILYQNNKERPDKKAKGFPAEAHNDALVTCRAWFKNGDVEDKDRSGRPKIYEDAELEEL